MITNFKAQLVEIPKVKKKADSDDLIEYGKFTVNKKYRVYSVYSSETVTQFLVADDTGQFYWIDTGVFRK